MPFLVKIWTLGWRRVGKLGEMCGVEIESGNKTCSIPLEALREALQVGILGHHSLIMPAGVVMIRDK